MIKSLKKQVNKEDFYNIYISIMNGILKLTDKEKNIVIELLKARELDRKIYKFKTSLEIEESILNSTNRQMLRDKLNISAQNLNNYIKVLKDKNILVEDNNILRLSDKILIESEDCELKFTIEVIDNKV